MEVHIDERMPLEICIPLKLWNCKVCGKIGEAVKIWRSLKDSSMKKRVIDEQLRLLAVADEESFLYASNLLCLVVRADGESVRSYVVREIEFIQKFSEFREIRKSALEIRWACNSGDFEDWELTGRFCTGDDDNKWLFSSSNHLAMPEIPSFV